MDLSYYGFIVSSLNRDLLFVFGNHNLAKMDLFTNKSGRSLHDTSVYDSVPAMKHTYGSTYIDSRVVRKKGLLIGGLGGSYRYNNGRNQFTETGMLFKIIKLLPVLFFNRIFHGRWLDILVTHAPPRGINDRKDICHRGFEIFKPFLKFFKPRFLIHGHIHLQDINAQRVTSFENTKVINVYNHYILEIE